MNSSRGMRVSAAIAALLLVSISGFAQQDAKKNWSAPSLYGTTGLFKTWDAETLRGGETNWTFGWDQFHRDPGQLTVGRGPVGGAVGIFDRLEFFSTFDVQRRVRARNIDTYRRTAATPPLRATTPTGAQLFTQAAPFMDVPEGIGRGDLNLGLKFNVFSERRGAPVSFAIAGFGTLPGQRTATGLSRGLSSGSFQWGVAEMLSKTVGDFARLNLNGGANFYTNPRVNDVQVADLQNEFFYRVGGEFPVSKPYRVIGEVTQTVYFGNGDAGLNPNDPVEVIVGMRVYPREWVSFGAGYQITLNHMEDNATIGALASDYHGFVAQAAFATRRNDPPKVNCAVAKATILQRDTTTIRANAVDPDRDELEYSWSATGGKVTGTGDTATFDATGVAPGKYTVTVVVKDGKHEVSCSTDITVQKRNQPPTATVEPSSFEITQGETANLRCNASDPNNDQLTYSWSVGGQKLAAEGPQIAFGSEGRNPGSYDVTCTVSDGEESATATSRGTVKERIKPNQPPTVECLTSTMDVASGSSIDLRAKASDPDGDALSYNWSAAAGSVDGRGESGTYKAAGVKAGSYPVTVTADDGRGGKASCSMTVNVSELIVVARDNCGYFAQGGARVDNCAKAILDDLAVRMKNDPKLRANVIGYTDGRGERTNRKLGERRAKAMAAYLEKQGVESSRLTVTNGGDKNPAGDNKKASGRKLNRRVEIELAVR